MKLSFMEDGVYTGIDALWWAKEAENLGAGEICLNSIDADGTQEGYELELTPLISTNVRIPVIASGGAGKPEHLVDVLTRGKADAALIASMVHYRHYTISEIKSISTHAWCKNEDDVVMRRIPMSSPLIILLDNTILTDKK